MQPSKNQVHCEEVVERSLKPPARVRLMDEITHGLSSELIEDCSQQSALWQLHNYLINLLTADTTQVPTWKSQAASKH